MHSSAIIEHNSKRIKYKSFENKMTSFHLIPKELTTHIINVIDRQMKQQSMDRLVDQLLC